MIRVICFIKKAKKKKCNYIDEGAPVFVRVYVCVCNYNDGWSGRPLFRFIDEGAGPDQKEREASASYYTYAGVG